MQFLYRLLLGIIAALIAVEVLLRCLPVSTSTETDYYITPSIITYPAHHKFVMATGWNLSNAHHHQSNNFGFLTHRDFLPNTNAIALIGDSYVEANMLMEDDRLNTQLESKLENRPVYAFGGPGSSLLDYAERARFAQEHLGVRDFVFIIALGDVRESLCGSGNIHGPCLDRATLSVRSEAQPKKVSLAKKILRQSALAQYLFSQLRLKPEELFTKLFANTSSEKTNTPPAPTHQLKASEDLQPIAVDRVVSAFLTSLPKNRNGRLLLVFDSYHDDLTGTDPNQTPVRDRFIQLTRQAGIELIDTKPIFDAFSQTTGLSLSVSPTDGHWNRLAHGLMADAIAAKLESIKITQQ
ncbi:MAG: hypothetical protein ACXWTS_07985 [Methylococcaceae bacterium]